MTTKIRQMGVSIPGHVEFESGLVRWAPRLPQYTGFKMAAELQGAVGMPVAVENDCNLAALAELWLSEAKGDHIRDFVFIEIGDEGVGGGIILNRELYRGHDGALAGEFGHMIVESNGIVCSCGRRGCLEMYVCNRATFTRYRPGQNLTANRFQQFLGLVREGVPGAIAAMDETSKYLSFGLSNIAFAFNPAVIIVAGAISGVWQSISQSVDGRYGAVVPDVVIRQSQLHEDQLFLRGAIHLALSTVFGRPKVGW